VILVERRSQYEEGKHVKRGILSVRVAWWVGFLVPLGHNVQSIKSHYGRDVRRGRDKMKVHILREQVEKTERKGFAGKEQILFFKVSFTVQFSEDERALFRKYQLADTYVAEKDREKSYYLSDLEQGVITKEDRLLPEIQEFEDKVLSNLKKIKNHLTIAEEYKGKEIELEI
jgi:hypothetical protein